MHAAIRADPVKEKKSRSKPSETKNWKPAKLTYDERKANLKVSLHYLPPHSCGLGQNGLQHSLVSSCGLLPTPCTRWLPSICGIWSRALMLLCTCCPQAKLAALQEAGGDREEEDYEEDDDE